MQKQVVARGGGKSPNEHAIMRVELVQAKTVWEYQPGPKETFYKITCSMPNLVTTTRSVNLSSCPSCALLCIGPLHLGTFPQKHSRYFAVPSCACELNVHKDMLTYAAPGPALLLSMKAPPRGG
jgi:hypothetical protein